MQGTQVKPVGASFWEDQAEGDGQGEPVTDRELAKMAPPKPSSVSMAEFVLTWEMQATQGLLVCD